MIIIVLVIAVGVLLYPKLFTSDRFKELRDEEGRITIAVLPFENQTGDSALNWFGKGISSMMTNGLGSSAELAVYDDQSLFEMMEGMNLVNTAGISRTQAREIAGKARAESYISGSYQGRDGKYWILANLVNTESGDIILTRKVEGVMPNTRIPTIVAIAVNASSIGRASPNLLLITVAIRQPTRLPSETQTRIEPTHSGLSPASRVANSI